jgi:hypothetical protein
MVQGVWSNDAQAQYEATQKFRKLLSIGARPPPGRRLAGPPLARSSSPRPTPPPPPPPAERNPPIEEVIKQGVIPRFVEFLKRGDMPSLQVGAAQGRAQPASMAAMHACMPAPQPPGHPTHPTPRPAAAQGQAAQRGRQPQLLWGLGARAQRGDPPAPFCGCAAARSLRQPGPSPTWRPAPATTPRW